MKMQIRKFTIQPCIPPALAFLEELSRNVWWAWNHEAIALFRRLDADLFSVCGHNPVKMLGSIDQRRLKELAADAGFVAQMERVASEYKQYLTRKSWFEETYPNSTAKVAYFSAEFGLHESLPIYSGGLGMLAGDHLKSASDLGIPLVAVGLCYQQGYFRQYLNADGWQQERYPENDYYTMPCTLERDKAGNPVVVGIDFPGRVVHVQVWKVQIGRISLYLLDTNIPQNGADDRSITAQLYGGDQEMRVKQEMVLGIGGLRVLAAIGIKPNVCHMNEGHSAFLAIERTLMVMQQQSLDFHAAKEIVSAGCVFTTHTPVEAGNDMFPPYLVDQYLQPYYSRLGIGKDEFLALGRQKADDRSEPFCMTVLAIRLANHVNGVSELHGRVSRRMWHNIWPGLPENEIPIESITNGVHVASYLCPEMAQLFDRYLGPRLKERPADHTIWERVKTIPDAELWRTHERRRDRLVAFSRSRLESQLRARGAPGPEIASAVEALDPDVLTIGFARRFATYKRASLIFRNLDRLASIVNKEKRPVQFIFAGKAHPKDHGGKELIAQIIHVARREEFRRRIVFIEDYDVNVARYLVSGVDVWLNNPRRPLEASGTSGMKGPGNGILNFSVLDGWWVEGYHHDNGWAIGAGEEYSDLNYHDEIESRAIYDLLEKEIVPIFYDRKADGLPREWIRRMKRSMMTVCPAFNTHRMVAEYTTRFYLPAAERYEQLAGRGAAGGKELAGWFKRVQGSWGNLHVVKIEEATQRRIEVGTSLSVNAEIDLGGLSPNDVKVELFHGGVDARGQLISATPIVMRHIPGSAGRQQYVGSIPCEASGQYGYAVRILPTHPLLTRTFEPGLIKWG